MNWSRIVLYREAKRLLDSLHIENMDALEVSPSEVSFWTTVGFGSYTATAPYPAFDILLSSQQPAGTYDFVILDNLLEHLIKPKLALENVKKMLAPGGFCFVATPFMLRVHPAPLDLWRFTEQGLTMLLDEAGLKPRSVGSWGNRECITAALNAPHSWVGYEEGMSLENDVEHPVMVWALASST